MKSVFQPKTLCILIAVMIAAIVLFPHAASAETPAQKAEELFRACLQEHPEYLSAVRFDLNGDGVDEMLASEGEMFPTSSVLYALSENVDQLLSWNLFSRFSNYMYEPKTRSLITSSGGSGVAEYCMMSLSGNDLVVRHIGKNLEFWDLGDRYFDYTEIIPGGENAIVGYNFGQMITPDHFAVPLLDILDGHAVSEEAYQTWYDYFQHLECVIFYPTAEYGRWEASRTGENTLETAGVAFPQSASAESFAQKAEDLFRACLQEHPEYLSAVHFDLNGDGVDELLVSESSYYPGEAFLYPRSVKYETTARETREKTR